MDSLYHLSTSEPKELWVILLSVHKNKKKVIHILGNISIVYELVIKSEGFENITQNALVNIIREF